mmetsp:Transcript_12368/g.43052  ORF Transcript_12368/g.43052 Transcript_12368/m.43052 type:complete len:261 (+) Transcript_12368:2192-2974(+)
MVPSMHVPSERRRPPVLPACRQLFPSIQWGGGDRLVVDSVADLSSLLLAVVEVTGGSLEPRVRKGRRDPSCMPAPLVEERSSCGVGREVEGVDVDGEDLGRAEMVDEDAEEALGGEGGEIKLVHVLSRQVPIRRYELQRHLQHRLERIVTHDPCSGRVERKANRSLLHRAEGNEGVVGEQGELSPRGVGDVPRPGEELSSLPDGEEGDAALPHGVVAAVLHGDWGDREDRTVTSDPFSLPLPGLDRHAGLVSGVGHQEHD